ncbi:MAG: disulfide bond formation protein B [Actinomycetota bacterium]
MAVDTVTLFFALLAVFAAAGTLAVGLSAVAGDRLGLRSAVGPVGLELAAAVAVTATLGSLYLSEVAGYAPCRLCWVQRAFMYPGAVLLPLAIVTRNRWPALVAAGLAVPGLAVAVFHRYEQASGGEPGFCDPAVPCTFRWVDHFGFVTIPTMAAVAFAAVAVLVAVSPSATGATQTRGD